MNIIELAKALNIKENTKLTFTDTTRVGYLVPFCTYYILAKDGEIEIMSLEWFTKHFSDVAKMKFNNLNIELS